ncbi:Zinc finger protein ZAT5 [Morus notabilis]|uniref:Zinc finger protein ZAT5 n=1 Tax=Morus notabilis TaxID=981085 RepID=W9R8C9_9ROSA|nr:zinc finger protein ZAT5 [Morus notabilis]EXB75903.1 Zinc finger protein ZAT5 [Morus notabilis]
MEAQEDYNQLMIKQMTIKGKRTKRHRAQPHGPVSSLVLSIAPSSSSSSGGAGGLALLDGVSTSSSDDQSAEIISRTEEEDMANCLILLAQGRDRHDHHGDRDGPRNSEPAAVRHANDVVYQCKTCDRCFPSFQALGGHRASHKKPKGNNSAAEEKKTSFFLVEDHEQFVSSATSTTLSLQMSSRGILRNGNNRISVSNTNNSNKAKVHECSICGAEFTSGQALGGHMRRHRATSFMTAPTTLSVGTTSSSDHQSRESKKPRNVLQLDLNLPALDDDRRETKFPFSSKEQVIVFAASPLVDCHY